MTVPESVVRMQLTANGEAGRAWLARLPTIVDELCQRWSLSELGSAFEGGCVAFVAPAVRADGSRVVLKISLMDEETECEADALALWNGRGAVRLLDADRAKGGLLLERAEPGTSLAAHPERSEALGIACTLLRRLWVPVPAGHRFPRATELARRWADTFEDKYREAGKPFASLLLRRAIEVCRRLAADTEACTLANRDFHLGNVLAAEREPWLAIDPKPVVADPAFDTGHLIRSLLPERIEKAEMKELIATVARRLHLEPERMNDWVFVRSIENALLNASIARNEMEWDVICAEAALP